MNTHAFTLRPASAADAATVHALVYELAVYERLAHEVSSTPADFARALGSETSTVEVVLAEEGDEAVGFALFFENYSTFLGRPGLYLEDLFVRPDRRRRGIGERLLQHVLALARERGYGRVDWAVLDWNEPALRFYTEKLGATLLTEWRMCRVTL